jgi:hypothetical protein
MFMLRCLLPFQVAALIVFTAAPSQSSPYAPLRIRVFDRAGVPGLTMGYAEAEAERLLATAGIRIEWLNIRATEIRPYRFACMSSDVCLEVVRGSKPGLEQNVFSAAIWHASEARGLVLYDRVLAARRPSVFAFQILGKTMAHEVGHLLLGPESNSGTGIMRPLWATRDFDFERGALWFFTPQQRSSMHAEVARRGLSAVSIDGGNNPIPTLNCRYSNQPSSVLLQ